MAADRRALGVAVASVPDGDHFGAQLAAGDFNNNGSAIWPLPPPPKVSVPPFGAGAVSVLPGSTGGLTTAGGQLFTQDSPGVPGVAEGGDLFGGTDLIAG